MTKKRVAALAATVAVLCGIVVTGIASMSYQSDDSPSPPISTPAPSNLPPPTSVPEPETVLSDSVQLSVSTINRGEPAFKILDVVDLDTAALDALPRLIEGIEAADESKSYFAPYAFHKMITAAESTALLNALPFTDTSELTQGKSHSVIVNYNDETYLVMLSA